VAEQEAAVDIALVVLLQVVDQDHLVEDPEVE
jgi:hypothetical protein